LLEIENPRPDEPIAHDEGLIDRHGGPALKLTRGGLDGFDQGGVFHAATDLVSSRRSSNSDFSKSPSGSTMAFERWLTQRIERGNFRFLHDGLPKRADKHELGGGELRVLADP